MPDCVVDGGLVYKAERVGRREDLHRDGWVLCVSATVSDVRRRCPLPPAPCPRTLIHLRQPAHDRRDEPRPLGASGDNDNAEDAIVGLRPVLSCAEWCLGVERGIRVGNVRV